MKQRCLYPQVRSFYTSEGAGKKKSRFKAIVTKTLSPDEQSLSIIIRDLTI
jgi:hypothetical protein